MAYEVTRDMPMQEIEVETPLETTTGKVIDGKKLVFVSILRAGTGILDGMLSVVPGARVGHIGLYRDPKTLDRRRVLLQDARRHAGARHDGGRPDAGHRQLGHRRGGAAEGMRPQVDQVRLPADLPRRRCGPAQGAPRRADLHRRHRPPTQQHGYILPGLGDAGDRIFGTK